MMMNSNFNGDMMMASGLIKTLGLAGAALTAWYFLDPKRGSERRENFVKSSKDIFSTASDELTRLGKDLASGVSDVVDRVGQMTGMSGNGTGTTAESSTQLTSADKTSTQEAAASRSESFSAPLSA
jgi:hypothetical protein